jgi:hypothetical protein
MMKNSARIEPLEHKLDEDIHQIQASSLSVADDFYDRIPISTGRILVFQP